MWKATIDNTTGLMIESQGEGANDEAMIANAVRAGFSDVSVRVVTDEEHEALIQARLGPAYNIAAIKAKAGQLILARLPDYKQRNYLARKAELQDILIAGGKLSTSEQAEWDFFAAEWAWAKAVRETSNAAEIAGTPVDEIVWPI